MTQTPELRICILSPWDTDREMTTFVRAHVARLPGSKTVLHGPRLLDAAGRSVSAVPAWGRALARGLPGASNTEFLRSLSRSAVVRFLRKNKYDVVFAEFGQMGTVISQACAVADLPLVVHFHGYDAYKRDVLDRYAPAYRQMFQSCALVVVGSEHMAAQVVFLGAPAAKVRCNPGGGVDCSAFTAGSPAQAPPLFIAVGRFVEKKAPHLTLAAFRRVVDVCPEARLQMIGDGELMPVCRDLVSALGMEGAVELTGKLPHAEVAVRLRGARAFVQHSVRASNGDCEGTAITPREAGASGLPVVATRHAGIMEAVVEGETGFLVEERDVAAMADRMLRLARDPGLAQRMGEAGRARVCRDYTMEQCIGGLYDILSEAARRR
jgi:colanic acid/amylovoran biosynthesis glycosyltransferase